MDECSSRDGWVGGGGGGGGEEEESPAASGVGRVEE